MFFLPKVNFEDRINEWINLVIQEPEPINVDIGKADRESDKSVLEEAKRRIFNIIDILEYDFILSSSYLFQISTLFIIAITSYVFMCFYFCF